jgi:hypothetical protein
MPDSIADFIREASRRMGRQLRFSTLGFAIPPVDAIFGLFRRTGGIAMSIKEIQPLMLAKSERLSRATHVPTGALT